MPHSGVYEVPFSIFEVLVGIAVFINGFAFPCTFRVTFIFGGTYCMLLGGLAFAVFGC